MNYKLIMLENPILVSDEKPSETDYYWDSKQNTIRIGTNNCVEGGYKKKIIAGYDSLPQIDFSILSEEDCKTIKFVNVDKLRAIALANKNYDLNDNFNVSAAGGIVTGKQIGRAHV